MKKIIITTIIAVLLSISASADIVNNKWFVNFQADISYSTQTLLEADRTFGVDASVDEAQFRASINNTQIGFMSTKMYTDKSMLLGYVSQYFYGKTTGGNYGSVTSALPRALLAFIKHTKANGNYTLIGQAVDLFAPLKPLGANPSSYLAINTGYLRPMFAKGQKVANGMFEYAICQPLSIDITLEPSIDNIKTPDIQLRYSTNNGLGLSAIIGKRVDATLTEYDTNGLAVDYSKKLKSSEMRCEFFTGQALTGYFGGLVKLDTVGANEIETSGLWLNYIKYLNKTDSISYMYGFQENDDKYLTLAGLVAKGVPGLKNNELFFISYCKQIPNTDMTITHELSYHNTEYINLPASKEYDAVRYAMTYKTNF